MSKGHLPHTTVDHYLQANILSQLASSKTAVRFSELKGDGIDNSLFMYHANKLLRLGLIGKDSDGFSLTIRGARWVNSVNANTYRPTLTVLPLVQFLVVDDAYNILLCKRTGQLKELINEYILPGGLHKAGMTAAENAEHILAAWFPTSSIQPTLKTIAEVIHTFEGDSFVHHSLAHIFSVRLPQIVPPKDEERFAFEVLPLEAVRHNNTIFADSPFIPRVFEKLRESTLKSQEIFRIKR